MLNHLEHFLEVMAVEKYSSKNTVDAYRKDVGDYLKYLSKNCIELSESNGDAFENYIKNCLSDLSERTLSRKISANRQFYQFLVLEQIIKNNPLLNIKFPRKSKLLPKSLSKEQMDKLFSSLSQDKSNYGKRLHCMFELLYSTGLRVSELIKLRAASFIRYKDDNSLCEHLIIRGKGQKERMIILNPSALKALEDYFQIRYFFIPEAKKQKAVWLFPSMSKDGDLCHMSRQRIGQMFKKAACDAGIDPAILSPHKIRHTFASHMLQNGADVRFVQELLGHSDISSTQIYTKTLRSQAKKLVLEKHPFAIDKIKIE